VDETGPDTRYRLLETVRQFAREKLLDTDESAQLRDRHLEYFLNFAEVAEPKLSGEDQATWLDRMEADHDNLRSAIEWSLQGIKAQSALLLTSTVQPFWYVRGYHREGFEKLRSALALPTKNMRTVERAKALIAAGRLALWIQDFNLTASPMAEEALAISNQLEDKQNTVWALEILGRAARAQGQYAKARGFLEQSLSIQEEFGNEAGTARLLTWLAEASRDEGNLSEARTLFGEAIVRFRDVSDRNSQSYVLNELGFIALQQHNAREAAPLFVESLITNVRVMDRRGIARCLYGLARAAFAEGQMGRATRLFAAQDRIRASIMFPLSPAWREMFDRELAVAHAQLGDGAFNATWNAGLALTLDQAIALALEEPHS
jgi:tetratricopeptide (TPR) repeat protein